MKRRAMDILALAVVLVLGVLFYYPETDPLQSRYVFYADSFERAASSVNPEYDRRYQRYAWESYSPLVTLLARYALVTFHENRALAVTSLYLGLALTAAVLTYTANRFFFGVLSSLYITILLLYDRSLMPVARGLGVISVLLLPPLLLICIHALSRTQDRELSQRRRIVPAILLAVSGGLVYSLGGHETLYAVPCIVAFAGFLCVVWLFRSIRRRKPVPGPTIATLGGGTLAIGLACGIIALTCFGISPRQKPETFWNTLTYRSFVGKAFKDAKDEIQYPEPRRTLLLKSTFCEGKYLAGRGSHHSNTFLYPGPGFNGIIPLFVFPGFLIGLWEFGRSVWPRSRLRSSTLRDTPHVYFLLMCAILMGVFASIMLLTSDPKPTRYTVCIYPVFALSAMGYRRLVNASRALSTGPEWLRFPAIADRRLIFARVTTVMLLATFGVLIAQRLIKNYSDLDRYIARYRNQIPTEGLPELLKQASARYASKQVFFANKYVGRAWHPALGLMTGYERPANVTFINPTKRNPPVSEDAIVFIRSDTGEWRIGHAAEVNR